MSQRRLDAKTARHELTDHRFYRYRGCAPDPDDPRVAAGDPSLSVDAWQAPDTDGGEELEQRVARVEAAKAVCGRCPVLGACAVYGASVSADGRLAERHSILGGLTAVERTRVLVQERQRQAVARPVPAPVEQIRTAQKLAVLRALARFEEPELIAVAASVDVRTAKWQLSRLTTQLGLEKSASRVEVLEAAVARGLLERGEVAPGRRSATATGASSALVPVRRVRGRRVPVVRGQLAFDFDDSPPRTSAPVRSLFSSNRRLEAAA